MSSCRETTRKLASDELVDAGIGQRISVWLHLVLCRHCRRYAQQLSNMRHAASSLWRHEAEDASGDLERRIVDGLSSKKDTPPHTE